jgi:hypothetical protein
MINFDISLASELAFWGPLTFEPFPSFLLKKGELRPKRGFLDNVAHARENDVPIAEFMRVNNENKNLEKIREFINFIPKIEKLASELSDREGLKDYFKNRPGITEEQATNVYKYLHYVITTN